MTARKGTREKIVDAARKLQNAGGPEALTFDAVARRLGISKQAVIYWFPRKEDLIAAVAVPAVRDEAQVALSAMAGAKGAAAAAAAFVKAVGDFHLGDLDRFRLIYVASHLGGKPTIDMTGNLGAEIHSLTSAMYGALQGHLAEARGLAMPEARRAAVAAHMAVLGLALMVSMTERIGDPLAHDSRDLLDTMARLVSGNADSPRRG